MRFTSRTLRTLLLAALTALAATAGAHDGDHGPATTKTAAAGGTGADHIGKAETARWTESTYEAAASEANKKVLAGGKVATVTGEVVDVSCYMQLGKRGAAHVACGTKCIENGMPIGLVDEKDDLFILFAEEHHPRRDGQVDLKRVFLPHLAKTVTVTGMMSEMKGYKALFVQAAEIGGAVTTSAPDAPNAPKALEVKPAAPPAPAKAPEAPSGK